MKFVKEHCLSLGYVDLNLNYRRRSSRQKYIHSMRSAEFSYLCPSFIQYFIPASTEVPSMPSRHGYHDSAFNANPINASPKCDKAHPMQDRVYHPISTNQDDGWNLAL